MYLSYIFVYICHTYSSTGLEGLCPVLNVGGGGALAPKPPWLLCHCYISSVIIIIIIIIDVSFQLLLSLRCAVADPVEYKVDSLLCGCPDTAYFHTTPLVLKVGCMCISWWAIR